MWPSAWATKIVAHSDAARDGHAVMRLEEAERREIVQEAAVELDLGALVQRSSW